MNSLATRLLPAAALTLAVVSAVAQQPLPPNFKWASHVVFNKNQMPRLGNDSSWQQKTPHIAGNSRKEQIWGVLDYSFDTDLAWTDDMTVNFYVLMDASLITKAEYKDPLADPKQRFSFMQLTLRYSDIPKGKDHKVSAVLLPAALMRFGRVIAMGFEATVKGEVVFTTGNQMVAGELKKGLEMMIQKNPAVAKENWWTLQPIVGNDKCVKRDGYLVDRAKTPFAFSAIDDYEMSK